MGRGWGGRAGSTSWRSSPPAWRTSRRVGRRVCHRTGWALCLPPRSATGAGSRCLLHFPPPSGPPCVHVWRLRRQVGVGGREEGRTGPPVNYVHAGWTCSWTGVTARAIPLPARPPAWYVAGVSLIAFMTAELPALLSPCALRCVHSPPPAVGVASLWPPPHRPCLVDVSHTPARICERRGADRCI